MEACQNLCYKLASEEPLLKFIKTEMRLHCFTPREHVPLRLKPLGAFEARKVFKAMGVV